METRLLKTKADTSIIFSVTDILRKRFNTKKINFEKDYSKITFIKDSYGNVLIPDSGLFTSAYCKTGTVLKSGETISFVLNAVNVDNVELEYSLDVDYRNVMKWQKGNKFTLPIDKKFVSKFCQIRINVRTVRKYQPINVVDNSVIFTYRVDAGTSIS